MATEFELKFAATPETLGAIARELGDFSTIFMDSTYFDTADGALQAEKIALRLRKENNKRICCVKTPMGENRRGEWETEASSVAEGVPVLCKLGAPAQLLVFAPNSFVPICSTVFTRRAKTITLPSCTLELALDEGTLRGGGRTAPLCEVEIELKSGSEAAAAAYAQALVARYDLQPLRCSKFRRALALAKGE